MATKARIKFGSADANNQTIYNLIDSRLVFERPHDKYCPTGYPYVKSFDITVYPEHRDLFFHKWYTQKNKEDITLETDLMDTLGGYCATQTIILKGAVCYSLTEVMERINPKDEVRRRLYKVGIRAESLVVEKQDLKYYERQKTTAKVEKQVNEDGIEKKIKDRADKWQGNLTRYEKLKLAEHSFKIEKEYQIKMGEPMSQEDADMQKANPNRKFQMIPNDGKVVPQEVITYEKKVERDGVIVSETKTLIPEKVKNPNYDEKKDRPYQINCATCSLAYVLRRQGFDFKANPNIEEVKDKKTKKITQAGNDNYWLSLCGNLFNLWTDVDGNAAEPALVRDWMKRNNVHEMTPDLYRAFVEENTREEGIYILTCAWPDDKNLGDNRSGHATVVERWKDEDGNLHLNRIEPQTYRGETRLSLDSYYERMSPWPPSTKGIMRVDNKLFKFDYKDEEGKTHSKLFEK